MRRGLFVLCNVAALSGQELRSNRVGFNAASLYSASEGASSQGMYSRELVGYLWLFSARAAALNCNLRHVTSLSLMGSDPCNETELLAESDLDVTLLDRTDVGVHKRRDLCHLQRVSARTLSVPYSSLVPATTKTL